MFNGDLFDDPVGMDNLPDYYMAAITEQVFTHYAHQVSTNPLASESDIYEFKSGMMIWAELQDIDGYII